MNLSELFDEVEGREFDAGIRILSGFSSVRRALEYHDETIKLLIAELQDRPENQQKTLQRLLQVLKSDADSGHMHNYDSALTGYLYALNQVAPELAQQAIEAYSQTRNIFWAKRMAQHIQEAPQEAKPTGQ